MVEGCYSKFNILALNLTKREGEEVQARNVLVFNVTVALAVIIIHHYYFGKYC